MVQLSVVVPCFNEEASLDGCVTELARVLQEAVPSYEIILVDDGSTDRTAEVGRRLAAENPKIQLFSKPNGGIGSAITLGFSQAVGKYLTYAPADGQFDPAEIPRLLDAVQDADVVIGYKASLRSYPLVRRIHSWTYRMLLRCLFSIRSPDVNFIHLYEAGAYRTIVPCSLGSFFHAETVARAVALGLRIAQIPLTLRDRTSGSAKGAKPGAILKILVEMWAFRRAK
jgi:glycosyltransferase involved in cell wall biosynthesis